MQDNASTPSADPYPSHLSIEIDRGRLCKFLRWSRFMLWAVAFSLFGAFLSFGMAMDHVQRHHYTTLESIGLVARWVGLAVAVATLGALLVYLVFNHFQSRRFADSLEVSVEGGFLRIRQGSRSLSDRKIHFRSIVDYTVHRRHVMGFLPTDVLHMSTIGGGPAAFVSIPGIKDCLKVRDMLSEIDSLRENH